MRRLIEIAAACFAVLLIAMPAAADPALVRLREALRPGPHAVGFQTIERYDETRICSYRRGPDGSLRRGSRGRPIQAGVWYPAAAGDGAPGMVVGEYVFPNPGDYRFFDLAARFQGREVHRSIMPAVGNDRPRFLELMNAKMLAVRDAEPLPGPYPLVLYLPGSRGGFFENAPLCEHLAGHGYVVVSTHPMGFAFLDPALEQADFETLVRDAEYVIALARELPRVDCGKLAVVGHDIGGLEALLLQMRNTDVDAVASLGGWETLDDRIDLLRDNPFFRPSRVRAPLMSLAGLKAEERDGSLLERFGNADRVSLRFGEIPEDALTAYGLVAAKPGGGETPGTGSFAVYEATLRYVHRFLDYAIGGDRDSGAFVRKAPAVNGIDCPRATVMYMKGADAPPPADYLVEVCFVEGPRAARELWERYRAGGPFFAEEELAAVATEFLQQRRVEEAHEVNGIVVEAYPASPGAWFAFGRTSAWTGDLEGAISRLKKTLDLLPANESMTDDEKAAMQTAAEDMIGRVRRELERTRGDG